MPFQLGRGVFEVGFLASVVAAKSWFIANSSCSVGSLFGSLRPAQLFVAMVGVIQVGNFGKVFVFVFLEKSSRVASLTSFNRKPSSLEAKKMK